MTEISYWSWLLVPISTRNSCAMKCWNPSLDWVDWLNQQYLGETLKSSRNFPTYPWNIPQDTEPTVYDVYGSEFLSCGGERGGLNYAPVVCWGSLWKVYATDCTMDLWGVAMIEAGKNKDCHDIRTFVLTALFWLIELRLGVMRSQSLHCRNVCWQTVANIPGVKKMVVQGQLFHVSGVKGSDIISFLISPFKVTRCTVKQKQ